jgi:hypothetical protein
MEKSKVKQIISSRESNAWNCGGKLSDYFIQVKNLRERKRYFLADIVIRDQGGVLVERFNDCEYNKEIFDFNESGV